MPKTIIKVESPLKGVNRAAGREDQPPISIYDSLNVLPFDRSSRLRIGQRAGDAALFAAISAVNVLSLYQVTLGQETTTSGLTWSDEFNSNSPPYPDGPLTGNAGWIDDVTSGDPHWTVSSAKDGIIPTTSGNRYSLNDDITDVAGWVSGVDWEGGFSVTPDSTIDPTPSARQFYFQIGDSTNGNIFSAKYEETSPGNGTVTVFLNGDLQTYSASVPQDLPTILYLYYTQATNTLEVQLDGAGFDQTVTVLYPLNVSTPMIQIGGAGVVIGEVFLVNTAGGSTSISRKTRLIAVSGGDIYVGTTSGVSDIGNYLTNSKPSLTDFNGHVYAVDGTNTIDVDVAGLTAAPLVASAGTVPVGCRIARSWRGRLVLAGADSDPQNFFFSEAGDPTNWDFSNPDPGAAFAGNASTAGRVGDVILDMIPFSNDVMLIMGDHSIWAIRGDPTDGGSIDIVSSAIGILGRDAWCLGPDGSVYFMGTGGLYQVPPGYQVTLQPLSMTQYPQFFQTLDRSQSYFQMAYNRDKFGFYAFVTSINTGASTHFWYDSRTQSMWPLQYPDTHGPMSSLVYDGDGPDDRSLLLGGRDGTIRQISDHNRTDDSTDIESYVVLGPFNPVDGGAAVLTASTFDFGELAPADQSNPDRWGVTVSLQSGVDAYEVTEGTPRSTATIDCPIERRQKTMRQRLRGGWFTVKLANSADNNYWAFETAIFEFEPAGRLRERR